MSHLAEGQASSPLCFQRPIRYSMLLLFPILLLPRLPVGRVTFSCRTQRALRREQDHAFPSKAGERKVPAV